MVYRFFGMLVAMAGAVVWLSVPVIGQATGLQPTDMFRLRSVGAVEISPDGSRIAYDVRHSDRPGRPYARLRIVDVDSGASWPLVQEGDSASSPLWSPDGAWIAYFTSTEQGDGVAVARADGTEATWLAAVRGTNHPLPSSGARLAWSPDGRRLAFVSATDGPEVDANGDPMVITRYLYKPTAAEGRTRFNDNRRLHIFIVDIESQAVRQLTDGNYYEHSIDWSPRGHEIAFVSNRGPDPDRFFNYDLFTVRVGDGTIRRLTETRSAEYFPRWSPDGGRLAYLATTRPLTSSETTMEDTHVWSIEADGGERREIGASIDNRQGPPAWSSDGRSVFFTVRERGHVSLYRVPTAGSTPEVLVGGRGTLGGWSIAESGRLGFALATAAAPAELHVLDAPGPTASAGAGWAGRRISTLNDELLAERELAPVEAFDFESFDGTPIEAFLTKPLGVEDGASYPMIAVIHGGPHGQQGPAFNAQAQVYATQGWATLMVNYRGSVGYGQALADAIFKDQNGGEARDVLVAVDAALARYGWIDAERLGVEGRSYGGQLTNWLVTQTNRFDAAIPVAGISNLISFNYMAYYHDYLAVEFGGFPHEDGLMDLLWERSPIRYVHQVDTPVLLLHGENDNDVPIAEAEQFFVALKDVGVETEMVRYPREGHGIREVRHVVDVLERSVAWYRRHFEDGEATAVRSGPSQSIR